MYPVKYELDFYIPEDGILHSHIRENLKPYRGKSHRMRQSQACDPLHGRPEPSERHSAQRHKREL
jgi:hypothetical protein